MTQAAGTLEAGQTLIIDNAPATVVSVETVCGDFGFYSKVTVNQNGIDSILEVTPRQIFEVAK